MFDADKLRRGLLSLASNILYDLYTSAAPTFANTTELSYELNCTEFGILRTVYKWCSFTAHFCIGDNVVDAKRV